VNCAPISNPAHLERHITILFSMVGFSKFSAFFQNPDLLVVLDSMPHLAIAGAQYECFNLTSVTGFFGIMVIYFSLILTISAAMGAAISSPKKKEIKRSSFSLTLDRSRAQLISAKSPLPPSTVPSYCCPLGHSLCSARKTINPTPRSMILWRSACGHSLCCN
jgi:hypothetical protein